MSLINKKLKAMYIAQGVGLSVIALSIVCRKKSKTVDDQAICDKAIYWGTGLFIHSTIIVVGINTVRLGKKVLK